MSIRSDITFTINKVSRYFEKLNKIYQNAKKKENFQIFKEITKYGIHFSIEQNNHIKIFNNADYAGVTEKKSTTGFVFCIL